MRLLVWFVSLRGPGRSPTTRVSSVVTPSARISERFQERNTVHGVWGGVTSASWFCNCSDARWNRCGCADTCCCGLPIA